MDNWKSIFNYDFRYIDHTNIKNFFKKPYNALTSFAIDDALVLSVSDRISPPTIRLWLHSKTVVLGIPDTRLPYLKKGVSFLKSTGYDVFVRNSGGLAVPLDTDVLNMSLILPNTKITIHDGYEAMYQFVRYIFRDLTDEIKAYEIVGSYCPGDYDLSINGVKFAGISQRRVKNGIAIQIYIDVNGNSADRGRTIQHFYEKSLKGEQTSFTYPTINPNKMGSLSHLLNKGITVETIKNKIVTSLQKLSENVIAETYFKTSEQENFQKRYEQMVKRNKKVPALRTNFES